MKTSHGTVWLACNVVETLWKRWKHWKCCRNILERFCRLGSNYFSWLLGRILGRTLNKCNRNVCCDRDNYWMSINNCRRRRRRRRWRYGNERLARAPLVLRTQFCRSPRVTQSTIPTIIIIIIIYIYFLGWVFFFSNRFFPPIFV